MSSQHSLLLLQPSPSEASRTYLQFESVKECLQHVCKIFEEDLRMQQSGEILQYEATQLLEFVDALEDVVCFVEKKRGTDLRYIPHGKDWLKEQLLKMLRAEAV